MKLNKGLLKKILNIFLCVLMVVTLISVNTAKTSAEDFDVSNEETSEVNQSEDKPDETDNTPTEEDNSIDEDADFDNEEVNITDTVETENTEPLIEETKQEKALKVESGTYTIIFDSNGGTGTMDNQVVNINETTKLAKNSFTREGNIFIGWNTGSEGTGTSYSDEESVKNLASADGSVTLFAKWKDSSVYWACTKSDKLYISASKISDIENESVYQVGSFNSENMPDWRGQTFISSITEVVIMDEIVPASLANWFFGFESLTKITGLANLKTRYCTSMFEMFCGCLSLISIDASSFDARSVTTMESMFADCNKATSISLPVNNTSLLTNTAGMFRCCGSLPSVDLSGLDTSSVTQMNDMFGGCMALQTLDASYLDTSCATNMQGMFCGCAALSSIDVEGFDTAEVTNMSYMFSACKSLTSLDLSGFDTTEVETMEAMFSESENIEVLDLSSFDTSSLVNTAYMFGNMSDLITIYVDETKWNTQNIEYYENMFYNDTNLTGMYGTKYDSKSDEYYGPEIARVDMPGYPGYLTSINTFTITFDANGGEGQMNDCYALAGGELYLPYCEFTKEGYEFLRWNTKADDSGLFFENDISNIAEKGKTITLYAIWQVDVPVTKDIYWAITDEFNLYLSAIETPSPENEKIVESNVFTYVPGYNFYPNWRMNSSSGYYTKIKKVIFNDLISPECCYYWFDSFYSLEEIVNLENLDTSNVTDMGDMFCNCYKLKEFKPSSRFITTKVTSMAFMFQGCNSLKSIDLSDCDTWIVDDMGSMFSGATSLESINLSGKFRTCCVTSMSGMFYNTSSLKYIDLSNFDTSNVTSMYEMFYGSGVGLLDLTGFDTTNVESMREMFRECYSLNSILFSDRFVTGKVTDMSLMFEQSNIEWLNLSSFNTSNLENAESMFKNCHSLKTIYASSDWTTEKITDSYNMFAGCDSLVGGMNTGYDSSVTDAKFAKIDEGNENPGYLTGIPQGYTICFDINNSEFAKRYSGGSTPYMYVQCGEKASLKENCFHIEHCSFTGWNTKKDGSGTSFEDKETIRNLAGDGEIIWLYAQWENTISDIYWSVSDDGSTLNISSSAIEGVDLNVFKPFKDSEIANWLPYFSIVPLYYQGQEFNCLGIGDIEKLTTVNFINEVKPDGLDSWFKDFTSLAEIKNIEYLNTSETTYMVGLFYGCSSLTSVDLTGFDTTKVIDFSDMFGKCESLTVLDLSSFELTNTACTAAMFQSCSNLQTIYVSDLWLLDTDRVYSTNMFKGCTSLVGQCGTSWLQAAGSQSDAEIENASSGTYAVIDGTDYSSGYLTDISNMITDGKEPTKNIYWAVTTDVKKLYISANEIVSVPDGGIKNGGCFFSGSIGPDWCDYAAEIEEVIIMDAIYPYSTELWFAKFSSLESIDLSNLYLDFVGYDYGGEYPGNMENMFYCCEKLNEVDLSGKNAEYNRDYFSMFGECKSLKMVDLSYFNTCNAENMGCMFCNCSKLETIYVGLGWATYSLNKDNDMFYECYSLVGQNGTRWDKKINEDKETACNSTYACIDNKVSAGYLSKKPNNDISYDIHWVVTEEGNLYISSKQINEIKGENIVDGNFFYSMEITPQWEKFADIIKSVNFIGRVAPLSTESWFKNFSLLETIDLEKLDTRYIGTEYDYGRFGNMASMFENCKSLKEVRFSNKDAVYCGVFAQMFYNCPNLRNVDLSGFMAHPIEMILMFAECGQLETLNLTSFDTAETCQMPAMFLNCSNLKTIYVSDLWLSGFDGDSTDMFVNCGNLVGGKGTPFNEKNINAEYARTDNPDGGEPGYFTETDKIYWSLSDDGTILNISSTRIKGVDLEKYKPFYIVSTPSWQGLSNDIKSKVTGVSFKNIVAPLTLNEWFKNFTGIVSIDFAKLDTSDVTTMSQMFYYARGLKSLDLSNFDTSKVTDMSDMFYFCNNLTSLDLSAFDTTNVNDMSGMFENCTSLTNIKLSSFDTNNVYDMSYMFKDMSAIVTLDISNFLTKHVLNMEYMFADMYKLTTIYVDEEKWTAESLEKFKDLNLFTGSTRLVGQNGTVYDKNIVDSSYAVVDKEGTPGYLSSKDASLLTGNIYWAATQSNKLYISNKDLSSITGETVKESGHFASDAKTPGWYSYSGKSSITEVIVNKKVSPEYMSGWFENFKALTTVTNISNINTINTVNMSYLFSGCTALASVDLSSFNTSKVTDMSYMFNGCTGLTVLDLSNFNTYNVKKMSYMFASCTDLTTIKVTGLWGVTSVISSTSMFNGDTSLKGMNNTAYDVSHTDKEYARIDEGEDNPGYLSEDTVSYTIVFDKNDFKAEGTMDSITAYLDEETVLTPNAFTKDEFIFDGWNTKADGTGTDYEDCATVTNLTTEADATVTLYAKWKEISNIYWAGTESTLYLASREITSSDLVSGDGSITNNGSFKVNEDITEGAFRLELNGFKDSRYRKVVFVDRIYPETTRNWFKNFYDLNSVVNINNLDTSGVYTMESMFANCYSLEILDVSGFDTSNVIDMSGMFYTCKALNTPDVSGFDTSNVISMASMFDGCCSMTNPDVSGFDTSNVANMNGMFNSCYKLLSLDLSNFDTSKVTSMSSMFNECYSLESLDLTSFDTANVTDMSLMFYYCQSMTSLDLSGFDTSKVISMSSMFNCCKKLNVLNLTSFNTASVTDMYSMFYDCTALTTIKVIKGKWNTDSVTSSGSMFKNCTKLIGGSGTPCDGTNNIDKTYARVDDPDNEEPGYLTGSTYYTVVYNANKGTSPEDAKIDYVGVDTNYKLLNNTFTPKDSDHVFTGWNTQADGKGAYYSENAVVNNLASAGNTITLYAVWNYDPIIYWGWNVSIFKASERVLNIASTEEGAGGILAKGHFRSSETPTWSIISKILINEINIVDEIAPVSTAGWFEDFVFASVINNISNLNTSNVTDMSYMFKNCGRLTTLDLSSFNTLKVTNMSNMFNDCADLKLINLSGFNTGNVTNMTKMFAYCDELVTITVKNNLDLSKVTSSSKMFKDDSNLIGSNGTYYNSSVTDKTYARIDAEGTPGYFSDESIPIIYWELSGSSGLFSSKKTKLTVTSDVNKVDAKTYKPFSAAQVPNWTGYDLSKVTTVEFLDNVTTYQVQGWFNKATAVNTINNLNYLNTSKVYDMSNMFAGCSKLTSIDLSGFVTARAVSMSNMFKDCKALTGIDLSTFDTSNVTDMSGMFSGCNSLTAINYPTASGEFKGFDTSKVTDMSYMFNKCYSIKSLNLYDYDTTNVTDMSYMFNNCTGLKLVDLSNQSEKILSKFDVSNVTDMTNMFNGDTSLKTIIVSNWTLNENVKSDNMFKDCTSIVGEQKTVYNASYIDRTYARVDEPGKGLPGYLTGTFYRFTIKDKLYTTFASALSAVDPGETIVMINDSNESLTCFNIEIDFVLDLNGNNLTVKSINLENKNAQLIDSADDEEKGSLSYTSKYGMVYYKELEKTDSEDTSIRYIPVCISNNTYQFNEVLVGTANKTTSSQYWREGDQAFVGSYLRNDLDVPTILADGSGVNLGIKITHGKTDKELVFERETIDEYIEKYTHAKPYFHVKGIEEDSITVNGYVTQKNGSIDYRFDGISRDITLVK